MPFLKELSTFLYQCTHAHIQSFLTISLQVLIHAYIFPYNWCSHMHTLSLPGGYPPLPHLAPTDCVFTPEHWKPLASHALLPLHNNCQSLKALWQLHILVTTVNQSYPLTIVLHHLCQPPHHPLSSCQTPIPMTIMHISL